jgi:hypothetical protein
MDSNAITKVVTQYMAAWNEPDDTARRALLEQCWSDSGVYLDSNVSLAGRDARRSARCWLAAPARGSSS